MPAINNQCASLGCIRSYDLRLSFLEKLQSVVIGGSLGTMTFPICLNIIQKAFWRPLGATSNIKIASVLGFLSFGVCHYVSCLVSFSGAKTALVFGANNCRVLQDNVKLSDLQIYFDCFIENLSDSSNLNVNKRTVSLISFIPNVTCFLLFGGKFRTLLPSHLLSVGAFAKRGVSCSIENATKKQRTEIQTLGKKYGCHSCGSKLLRQRVLSTISSKLCRSPQNVFIADHQPPVGMILRQYWARYRYNFLQTKHFNQALYPHCNSCSTRQGNLVKQLANSSKHNEGIFSSNGLLEKAVVVPSIFNFRLYFLWLPFVTASLLEHKDLVFLRQKCRFFS